MRIGKEATNKIQTRDHEVSNDSGSERKKCIAELFRVKNECFVEWWGWGGAVCPSLLRADRRAGRSSPGGSNQLSALDKGPSFRLSLQSTRRVPSRPNCTMISVQSVFFLSLARCQLLKASVLIQSLKLGKISDCQGAA